MSTVVMVLLVVDAFSIAAVLEPGWRHMVALYKQFREDGGGGEYEVRGGGGGEYEGGGGGEYEDGGGGGGEDEFGGGGEFIKRDLPFTPEASHLRTTEKRTKENTKKDVEISMFAIECRLKTL
ncbi:hypothetical protein R1flu_016944 [Riccia fluitans]|uniref:Glycine-rich protein n=1 Tax=Riccia fluitans TaxID=41844 RepID=A0ABD1YNU2_9MARC